MRVKLLYTLLVIPLISNGQLEIDVWQEFVNEPNTKNYLKCELQINLDMKGASWNEELFPYITRLWEKGIMRGILRLVEGGDVYATDLSFQLYPFMRGHWGEEFDISIGRGMKRDPELFLMLTDRHFKQQPEDARYKTQILGHLLGNFGPEFVDEFEAKMNEAGARIVVLKTVTNPKYERLQNKCIDILEERKESLQEIIKEMER